MVVIAVVGMVALILAVKLTRAFFRFVFGLIGFAAIVGSVGWFLLKH